jgi:hypothetical protein
VTEGKGDSATEGETEGDADGATEGDAEGDAEKDGPGAWPVVFQVKTCAVPAINNMPIPAKIQMSVFGSFSSIKNTSSSTLSREFRGASFSKIGIIKLPTNRQRFLGTRIVAGLKTLGFQPYQQIL